MWELLQFCPTLPDRGGVLELPSYYAVVVVSGSSSSSIVLLGAVMQLGTLPAEASLAITTKRIPSIHPWLIWLKANVIGVLKCALVALARCAIVWYLVALRWIDHPASRCLARLLLS